MTDTEQHRAFRKQFNKIKELASKLDDEVLIMAVDIISEELQARSDKQIKYHENRKRRLK
jgi:hypothetical protein